MRRIKAFSLIELLISLIIISLLIGAFAPIITKKLKATDVTVGSFSNGNTNNVIETTRDVTKEDCDKVKALYIPKEMNDGIKPVCVTKWNMGDGGLPLAASVRRLNVGQTCTDIGYCCWQGKTSSQCTSTGNGDSTYSGCNRTVCNLDASKISCAMYEPLEGTKGHWRLPKYKEVLGWKEAIDSETETNLKLTKWMGKDGLQLCDRNPSIKGTMQCLYLYHQCVGTHINHCNAYGIWTDDVEENTTNKYSFRLTDGKIVLDTNEGNRAMSARCVLDKINDHKPIEPDDKEPEIKTKEPENQADCDKYNAFFIPKAMNGGKTNVCATRYNIGDIYIDPVVNVAQVNSSECAGKYCCWKGQTAGDCTDNSYYSGCYRTVCNYWASEISCQTYNPDGKTKGFWRLPYFEEMHDGWFNNLTFMNKGAKGLQLCGYLTGETRCRHVNSICRGAYTESSKNLCDTSHYWFLVEKGDDVKSGISYAAPAYGGTEACPHIKKASFHARCVTDKIPI